MTAGRSLTGVEVARRFHAELVAPVIAREAPGLRYAAGRLGSGSDVLGLDDAMSRDHDWGCRLDVLVDEVDADALPRLREGLERDLPETFLGLPVRFGVSWDPGPTHNVGCDTVHGFASSRLGVSTRDGLSDVDWLCVTGQQVLEVIAGPLFHDDTRTWTDLKALLAGYPPQVERYLLVCCWRRLGENLHLLGRTGDRGGDVGWRLLAADLVESVVMLAFLIDRAWMPYPKWRQVLFDRLPLAAELGPLLRAALTAESWRPAEAALAGAADVLTTAQRGRGLPGPATGTTAFFDRPYRTVAEDWAADVLAELPPDLRSLPTVGSVEHWVGSVEVLARPERRHAIVAAYRSWLRAAAG